MNRRALVVGGNGFIGSSIALKLIQSNYDVHIASRSSKLCNPMKGSSFTSHRLDITRRDSIENVLSKTRFDLVVNCVGLMYGSSRLFESVQLEGAQNLAIAANSSKLIHLSAIGANPNSEIPYQRTKGLAEIAIQSHPNYCILRPSLVFGEYDDFFNRFSKLAKVLPVLPVFGGGHTKFQPVSVNDLAKFVEKAIELNGTFDVGGPDVFTFKELMEIVLRKNKIYRPILSVPWSIGMIQGFILEKLPVSMFTLTRDQVKLLKQDNICSSNQLIGQERLH